MEFVATPDGTAVDGIDMIPWNSEGNIVSLRAMIRPFTGLQVGVPTLTDISAQYWPRPIAGRQTLRGLIAKDGVDASRVDRPVQPIISA